MADSDSESYDSSSPRSSQYDDWTKEPLVGEKLTVYLLHWDKTTQAEPDIFDTTLVKPKDPSTIFRCVPDCVIHYHCTTLTPTQFVREYGMPPRTRGDEIMRLRQAMLEQYLTEVEMDRKKRHALSQTDLIQDADVPTLQTREMSPLDRLKYVTSLWPTNMPNFPDAVDSLKYYGFQVGILIDTNDETNDPNSTSRGDNSSIESSTAVSSDKGDTIDTPTDDADPTKTDADLPSPVLPPALPVKEENWVQCDKCQKWRKLPDSVDVSALPTTWYCRMNKWSRKYNKCSAAEETTAAPSVAVLESDLKTIRERKFVHQFGQRLKRMEKALAELKYADMKEDAGDRKHVVCDECGKKRPLLGGMDPGKVPKPFVCWMNRWDEIHASCSAPQGVLFERATAEAAVAATTTAPAASVADKKQTRQVKKQANKQNSRVKPKKKAPLAAADEDAKDVAPPPLYSSSDDDKSTRKRARKDDASTTKKK